MTIGSTLKYSLQLTVIESLFQSGTHETLTGSYLYLNIGGVGGEGGL